MVQQVLFNGVPHWVLAVSGYEALGVSEIDKILKQSEDISKETLVYVLVPVEGTTKRIEGLKFVPIAHCHHLPSAIDYTVSEWSQKK